MAIAVSVRIADISPRLPAGSKVIGRKVPSQHYQRRLRKDQQEVLQLVRGVSKMRTMKDWVQTVLWRKKLLGTTRTDVQGAVVRAVDFALAGG